MTKFKARLKSKEFVVALAKSLSTSMTKLIIKV